MLERVSRKRGVVSFYIHFEIFVKTVLPQKADSRRRVEVILVLHGFFRFGFDIKISLKAYASAVIHRHTHKARCIFLFEFHVGIEKRFIAFPAAPKHVTAPAELDGNIQSLLDLRGGKAIYVRAVCRARTVHITRI